MKFWPQKYRDERYSLIFFLFCEYVFVKIIFSDKNRIYQFLDISNKYFKFKNKIHQSIIY